MKQIKLFSIALILSIFFVSCGSTPVSDSDKKKEPVVDEVIDVTEDYSYPDDEEYKRSVQNVDVSREEFSEDKAQILKIIEDLSKIMEKEDVEAWLKYVSPDSVKYYSNPANIRKAQKKLPDKTITLHGIGDYFKYVFIPSRKRSEVDEIRYISKTNIKAVQVKQDKSVIVYYYFVKVNGKWMINIPTL